MPVAVCLANAHYIDGKVFITGGLLDKESCKVMQVYHIDDQKWEIISDIPQNLSGAHIIKGHLTLIGGNDAQTNKVTGKLSTYNDSWEAMYVNRHQSAWEEIYPPMPTARSWVSAVLEKDLLIAAGGQCSGVEVNTVEVLNIELKQWYSLKSLKLPHPLYLCRVTTSDGYVYIGGGVNAAKGGIKRYWRLPWSAVQQSVQSRDSSPVIWEKIADSPLIASSMLTNSKLPVLFGGAESSGKGKSDIFVYQPSQNTWTAVGNISTECTYPCVVPLNSNTVFVCGGYIGNNCTNKTELIVMCP